MEIRNNLINAVIELEEGVEYLLDEKAAEDIYNDSPLISVRRLIDGFISVVPLEIVKKAIKDPGIIDHISR
jgi:hypothetical protein